MPPVTTFRMNSRMTRSTQRNQIASVVCSSFSQRLDVMDLLHRNQLSFLVAPLTEGMLRSIAVTNPFPCSAVTFLCVRVSAVSFVLLVDEFFVFLTVTPVGQFLTARVSTGMLGLSWHRQHLLQGSKKALEDCSSKALFYALSISYSAMFVVRDFGHYCFP